MAMGTRKHRQRQEDLWVTHAELPTAPGHPFYKHLNELLDREKFDEFAEKECARFYADKNGRQSLTPGTYFRASATSRELIRNAGSYLCTSRRQFIPYVSPAAIRAHFIVVNCGS
jgi:hypothetical protein